MALPPHIGGLPRHVKTHPFLQPKPADLESMEVPVPAHRTIMHALPFMMISILWKIEWM